MSKLIVTTVLRYSSGNLCLKGVTLAVSSDIERQVTAGTVPLVGYLLADRAFIEVIQCV